MSSLAGQKMLALLQSCSFTVLGMFLQLYSPHMARGPPFLPGRPCRTADHPPGTILLPILMSIWPYHSRAVTYRPDAAPRNQLSLQQALEHGCLARSSAL